MTDEMTTAELSARIGSALQAGDAAAAEALFAQAGPDATRHPELLFLSGLLACLRGEFADGVDRFRIPGTPYSIHVPSAVKEWYLPLTLTLHKAAGSAKDVFTLNWKITLALDV
jgi:hypothetical protein